MQANWLDFREEKMIFGLGQHVANLAWRERQVPISVSSLCADRKSR